MSLLPHRTLYWEMILIFLQDDCIILSIPCIIFFFFLPFLEIRGESITQNAFPFPPFSLLLAYFRSYYSEVLVTLENIALRGKSLLEDDRLWLEHDETRERMQSLSEDIERLEAEYNRLRDDIDRSLASHILKSITKQCAILEARR